MHDARWSASRHRGSTGKIIREVEPAPAGTKWAIGTELHLVQAIEAGASGAGDSFPVAGRLHVRDDVPHRPGASVLEPGEPGRRHAGERDRGRSRDVALGAGRAGADAGSEIDANERCRPAGFSERQARACRYPAGRGLRCTRTTTPRALLGRRQRRSATGLAQLMADDVASLPISRFNTPNTLMNDQNDPSVTRGRAQR